ncbi:MAG: hypothetical protein ABSD74_11740 [Rhizomicrobium sp.]|jgi:hypothetical protein
MPFNRSRIAGVAIALAVVAAGPAQAQTSRFAAGQVETIDARDFVNEASGTQYVLNHSELVFTLKTTQEARRFERKGFQVRAFKLGIGDIPEPWARFDPCDVYFSNLWPASGNLKVSDNSINLGPVTHLDWLSVTRGAPPEDGRYLLVFENKTDTHGWFRLNENDKQGYFSRGLIIVVKPDPDQALSLDDINAQADRQSAAFDAILPVARTNGPQYSCYRLQNPEPATSLLPADMHVAALERCDPAMPSPG